jgi:hypothetical protein
MKHFREDEWVDFVNQVAPESNRLEMQKHLESDCKRCMAAVALWREVRKTAASEGHYQPSDQDVRNAKAAFAATRNRTPKRAAALVEVLFDTFSQPALAGARSAAGPGSRQLLYKAGPYHVNVQIEAKPEKNHLMIIGQLMDPEGMNFAGADIRVKLSNLRGSVTYTTTNEFGEFNCDIEDSGDLEISFWRQEEKPVAISLRNALNRLSDKSA